ncbi:23681_t:CDS:1, partial [Gigaspora margarita]
NAINSNETSNEACLEEIISNIEFDDMDNSDNKLVQFEENIMQTIANIDNFNANDQIIYNKQL